MDMSKKLIYRNIFTKRLTSITKVVHEYNGFEYIPVYVLNDGISNRGKRKCIRYKLKSILNPDIKKQEI